SWSVSGKNPDGSGCRVVWNAGIKTIQEDGKAVHDRKRLVERNPAIVFCHEDMEFARGEPERRRFFFDQTASLVSVGYIDQLRAYRRALKARNVALKEKSLDVLDVLDIQVATYGLDLRDERSRLANEFDERFAPRYELVSKLGTRVGVTYRPSWKLDATVDDVLAKLADMRERELALGTSLSGPHRDRFVFVDERGDFSGRASTGQLRLLSLTLRIAQAEYYAAVSGKAPTLLLDDVLLELDPVKRRRFMENLPPADQSYFTFLPGEPYKDYAKDDTIVYWTEHGRFTRTQSL
ncbi:MAG: DNA replication/repair protein RecF, partial [Spirochaetales bacterium]|nr:DNA replication/repair protein RecF [Spirochaetales bacterium]